MEGRTASRASGAGTARAGGHGGQRPIKGDRSTFPGNPDYGLERSNDGFHIAEADLALRGPGDFLGTRGAGLPEFRVANLLRDTALLRAARDEAVAWLEHDPTLTRPESKALRAVLQHRWRGRLGLALVG